MDRKPLGFLVSLALRDTIRPREVLSYLATKRSHASWAVMAEEIRGYTGTCGFGNVSNPLYNSLIAAGNQALYQDGKGCGQWYLVKCNSNPRCTGNPIKIHITDECSGVCNNVPVWFELSEIAFGALAEPGQADALRIVGKIQISYQK
ncbi:PREDICTED: putative expansin-B14 [Ipomoea nil]|uniref:putative expansin-B14 n=1 Tax=Ipomoea nil TaxID=35883 RepID=UPI000901A44C|nr:PREDICTED: putative expansin-B14 [Ipomoea nil]